MQTNPESRCRGTRWRVLAWAGWLLAATIAAAGLRHFRVDNSLDRWIPDLSSRGPFPTYVVLGWETDCIPAGRMAAQLRESEGVALVIDSTFLAPLAAAGLVRPEDFVISRDGRYMGLFCFSDGRRTDADFVENVRTAAAEVAAAADAQVAIAGPAAYRVALNDYSRRRMPVIIAAMLIVGGVALRWVSGSWRVAGASVAAVSLSQLILVGILSWRGQALDMSLSMVPPLMMALGFSYSAHRARRRGVGGVLALCGATTAAGIASFVFTPLEPIRLFAVYGVVGLILVWTVTATLVPRVPRPARRMRWNRAALAIVLLATRRPRLTTLAVAGTVLLLLAIAAVPAIQFEADALRYMPESEPVVRDFRQLDQRLVGMLPFQVTLRGHADAQSILVRTPGVRKVLDITTFVPGADQTLWCLASNDALQQLIDAQPDWNTWAHRHGIEMRWRGVAAQLAAAECVVWDNAVRSLPLMAAVSAVATVLALKRLRTMVIWFVIPLLPVSVLIIAVAVLEIPLGLPSLMIGAIAVGVGVDDTMHLAVASRRRRCVRRAIVECFRPCVGSSLTSAACLLLFTLSPLAPVRQFGILLAAAVGLAAAFNQLVVPPLLISVATSIQRRNRPTHCHGTPDTGREKLGAVGFEPTKA